MLVAAALAVVVAVGLGVLVAVERGVGVERGWVGVVVGRGGGLKGSAEAAAVGSISPDTASARVSSVAPARTTPAKRNSPGRKSDMGLHRIKRFIRGSLHSRPCTNQIHCNLTLSARQELWDHLARCARPEPMQARQTNLPGALLLCVLREQSGPNR